MISILNFFGRKYVLLLPNQLLGKWLLLFYSVCRVGLKTKVKNPIKNLWVVDFSFLIKTNPIDSHQLCNIHIHIHELIFFFCKGAIVSSVWSCLVVQSSKNICDLRIMFKYLFCNVNKLKLFIKNINQLKPRNFKSEIESNKFIQINERRFKKRKTRNL